MPQNGEVNTKFGVYKNVCCGTEIVIPEGVTFPECATHIKLTTEWKPAANSDRIPHVNELKKKIKSDPAA